MKAFFPKAAFFIGLTLSQISVQSQELTRIAFGSCNMPKLSQNIWPVILENKPQLWIWLGDNIYGEMSGHAKSLKGFKEKYDKQKSNPKYQMLTSTVPVIGTWDDHEFGGNDLGSDFAFKKESQQLLLDFLDEPQDSPRRKQEGVYASYEYGEDDKKVKVILLDTRYFRQEPGEETDMLGQTQWEWLEKELSTSTASLNIIGSSIQFLAKDHSFECWEKFPGAKKRMLELIAKTKAKGVVFISGDRHFSEISVYQGKEVDYPIYDHTSSGLTHGRAILPFDHNSQRIGPKYMRRNFGMLLIDWKKRTLTMQTHNLYNNVVIEYTVPLANLVPKT